MLNVLGSIDFDVFMSWSKYCSQRDSYISEKHCQKSVWIDSGNYSVSSLSGVISFMCSSQPCSVQFPVMTELGSVLLNLSDISQRESSLIS